jgi:hypothetical protein
MQRFVVIFVPFFTPLPLNEAVVGASKQIAQPLSGWQVADGGSGLGWSPSLPLSHFLSDLGPMGYL